MIDYLLREGFHMSASKFAKDMNIEALVDIEIFANARKIEDSLKNRSCAEGLQWWNDNKSRLKKLKPPSTFEFDLRLQEYIELVRNRKLKDAIAYSQKYFSQWRETHMKEIQQAMALLAFAPNTACAPYKDFFDEARWTKIIELFRQNNYMLFGLPSRSVLSIHMQSGLSALKTPYV